MSALWNVDLRARAGDFEVQARWEADDRVVALFGPSGAGKSTLVEALAGVRPASGRLRIGERQWVDGDRSMATQQRRVGWVPQDAALFPHWSVARNLDYALRPQVDRARVVEVLDLGALLARRPHQLSGGEAKRVALARALCSGPELLLLDEPLAGVDLVRRAQVFRFLKEVRDRFEIPMLYVSHDPAEVLAITGYVVLLDQGRVVGNGSPRRLLADAVALRFLDRLGFENVFAVSFAEEARSQHSVQVRTASGRRLVAPPAPSDPGEQGWLAIRAEDVLLAAEEPSALSARNVLSGTVAAVEESEGHLLVRVDAGDEWVATLTRRAVAELGIAPGRPVWVVAKTHSLHWL